METNSNSNNSNKNNNNNNKSSSSSSGSSSKRHKKGRKSHVTSQHQTQHHPWDEVSLPGAGIGTTEQPTILLLNQAKLNGDSLETEAKTAVTAAAEAAEAVVAAAHDQKHKAAQLKLQLDESQQSPAAAAHTPTTPGGSNVLDIESHLIEDVNGCALEELACGVGINELPPIEQELQQGTSKVETDDAAGVIEVEPAGAKIRQAIETLAPAHQIAEVDETAQLREEQSAVQQTAEQLVNEIEQELIETLSRPPTTGQNVDKQLTAETKEDLQALNTLSQQVDAQLSELTSILKTKTQPQPPPQTETETATATAPEELLPPQSHPEIVCPQSSDEPAESASVLKAASNELKLVEVPTPKTAAEEQQRKAFIDSLPQIDAASPETETDAKNLSADCKREYYQSLKKYLLQSSQDKPPVPLQTYRWEDLKRAKERGGYPWTHLYKRPLGPDEEPEIVLLLRKSQELRFKSESPKSLKKVRYDEQVLVKETERYIQDLSEDEVVGDTTDDSSEESETESDEEEHNAHNEDALSECISCVSDSVLAVGGHARPRKTNRLAQIRSILKRRRSGRTQEDAQSLPGNSANTSRQSSVHELAPPPGSLVPDPAAVAAGAAAEKQRKPKQSFDIMKKLKSLAERQKKRLNIKRITLKKDEKIVLGEQQKIIKLKQSPKSDRSEIPHFIEKQDSDDVLELVEYEESPCRKRNKQEEEEELQLQLQQQQQQQQAQQDEVPTTSSSILQPDEIIELPIIEPEVEVAPPAELEQAPPKKAPRLRREHVYEEIGQGLVEQPLQEPLELDSVDALKKSLTRQDHLVLDEVEANKSIPLDRMGSSEEEQAAAAAAAAAAMDKSSGLLAPLCSIDSTSSDEERARLAQLSPVTEETEEAAAEHDEPRPSLKKEASPAPSDKKVTFSHIEDEAEPHREDVELPDEVLEAAAEAAKWKNVSDHEYEPIGVTPSPRESSPAVAPISVAASAQQNGSAMDIDVAVEERYLSSAGTTPITESRTDYETHTDPVDYSALEEPPLQPEQRKKGFMATAQDRTRKMQDGLRNQAGKIRTKLRPQPKKPVSGSPKAKERRRFKAPEFAKIKMPEIKRPDMSKFKELKRPEFTKFNKPDMSKFKLPEKFSTLKLRRSKSFKENEPTIDSELPAAPFESPATADAAPAPKKKFEFNFGTYPRAFRKKKPVEPVVAVESSLGTEGLSVIPSTETQPSSTSSPKGDRGPGPVRSRWADKFSDVSYNDSEGSRYRRYGSEMESFDRESSLERRMKEDLEDTGSEAQPQAEQHEMGILSSAADSKQFAEFNEENRAIHEISKLRSREFQRRPLVHQDSDLRSEDSRETEGWTEKDIQKNKLLRKAELEAENSYFKYHKEGSMVQDAQSTASSGKKVVMEEINDDEFFMRKRGISEDNIQLRQYISAAIREGYDMPNALANVGQSGELPMEYGDYDVPPPKPRRLHKNYRPDYSDSQEFQRSEYGDDLSMSQNGSDFLPKRPLRKARSRSKYSMDSQDLPMADEGSNVQYFDDDEEYLRPPMREQVPTDSEEALNNFNINAAAAGPPRPLAPRRQKKRARDEVSVEKDADAFFNGFSGRSVSNTFLQPQEDVIVYRTEHQYHIPLATPDNFTDGASARTRVSEDDRTSRGADSLVLDIQMKPEQQLADMPVPQEGDDKFVIDMLENDGYAVVRKELLPKPTPPARRKKFARSVGERFATLPTRGSPPPARPPPPLQYTPSDSPLLPARRRSTASLDNMAAGMDSTAGVGVGVGMGMGPGMPTILVKSNNEEDDYEEPEALERPESPRSNLQSGEVINKMKYRPLPPPPRPPRGERRHRGGSGSGPDSKGDRTDDERYEDSERIATSSTADSYDQHEFEVEVSTQTDPLPDDFVCEEFEITEDMKIIEPRRSAGSRTLEDLLRSTQREADEVDGTRPLTEDEQLARGLQRFRDANQRSMSERSRNSSQADRSKSLSRPQTPSAIVIERRVPTPSPTGAEDDTLQASLIVRPISAADLADEELRREEEELRREGLLSDSSVQSKSDVETAGEEEEEAVQVALSDYAASSADLDAAVEQLQQAQLESDYESKLEDDEVERTLRDSEYDEEQDEDAATEEKYSDHYDEEDDWKKEQLLPEPDQQEQEEQQLTEQELEALEQELQKELAEYIKHDTQAQQETSSVSDVRQSEEEEEAESELELTVQEVFAVAKTSKASETAVDAATAAVPTEAESKFKFVASFPTESAADHVEAEELEPIEIPLPPPRRKSTTLIEPAAVHTLTIAEQSSRELTPVTSVQSQSSMDTQNLPCRLPELEVERLRVHALQAGQIMVSQLHGEAISADELECKSGNLVVKNIELPPGFIEDIVERVRSSEQRAPLLTTETQTSRQPSSDLDVEPPLKPPRQSKVAEATADAASSTLPLGNLDEQTQTEAALLPLPPPPTVYPSVEYLQSLAPLAFYNLQRSGEAEQDADAATISSSDRKAPHKCRRRHAQQRRSELEEDELPASGSDLDEPLLERPRSRRSRTRSVTQPPDEDEPKTVMQAGKQFIAACSLELINIINQLTNYVRGDIADPQQQQQQPRNVSALMVLFILITFGLLVYLLTGRQVHTHHWDYFNPPSNDGRQT